MEFCIYGFLPFGTLLAKTGALDQPFQFSTKRIDALTGLVYYGYRFYSTEPDRRTTRDPLGEAGGVNLYAFVGNNPVNWVDPLGLELFVCGRLSKPRVLKTIQANHVYIYDSVSEQYIGMGGSFENPAENACRLAGDPENIDEIFDYFNTRQSQGIVLPIIGNWKPFINDCHAVVDDTLIFVA